MNNEDIIKKIEQLNEKYLKNNQQGAREEELNFKIIKGTEPIILSAPHAVRQNPGDRLKAAEKYTGAIVEYLCEKTGAYGIVRIANLGDNPNNENVGYGLKYKQAISQLIEEYNIKCLIDFHGCKDIYGFDFDIGTCYRENINNKENYLRVIEKSLEKIGIVTIDEKFKANREVVISNYISKKNKIACFQIEISKKLRGSNQELIQLLNQLEVMIKDLYNEII